MPRQNRSRRYRGVLQWLAVARIALGIAAIPLAPILYRDHLLGLILLRPTKEVLLYAGFRLREGDIGLATILVATVPLLVFGVWLFFVLGRGYARELHSGDMPRIAAKVMPPKRVKAMSKVLDEKGTRVVLLGRLAAFPSALLATTAGASDMEPRRFLPLDGAGALLSIAEVLIAGYAFGEAYDHAGKWITAVGVAILFALLFVVGRALRR